MRFAKMDVAEISYMSKGVFLRKEAVSANPPF
jgi:hypothetical protein